MKEKTEPSVLYHYTSLEALFSIISKVETIRTGETPSEGERHIKLWASHCDFLNDSTEGTLLPNVLKRFKKFKDLDIYALASMSGYPLIISFSELEDDLNMWRSYANDGRGVAIGFNFKKLNEIKEVDCDRRPLCKCEYTTGNSLWEQYKNRDFPEVYENLSPLSKELNNMMKYKDSHFASEKEWRFVACDIPNKFRMSKNLIIPYKEISMPLDIIDSITLGPQCDLERNRFSIGRLIPSGCDIDHKIKISKSEVPYV